MHPMTPPTPEHVTLLRIFVGGLAGCFAGVTVGAWLAARRARHEAAKSDIWVWDGSGWSRPEDSQDAEAGSFPQAWPPRDVTKP